MYRPSNTVLGIAAVLVASAIYLWRLVRWYRIEQFKRYPRIPPDPLWGHLKMMGDALKKVPKGAHSDYCWEVCRDEYDPSAPFLQFDMRPALPTPLCLVFNHEVAEQCSKPSKTYKYSMTKSFTNKYLAPLTGHNTILTLEGEEWKAVRKNFNPGFAPNHLNSLLPLIIDRTKRFLTRLDARCKTGETFELEPLCTNLTFDIIGAVTLNMDMNAQDEPSRRHPLVKGYGDLIPLFQAGAASAIKLPNPLKTWKIQQLGNGVDSEVKKAIRQTFDEMKARRGEQKEATDGRSIVELSLREVEGDVLSEQKLQETADSIKTFMFAGHDTTSTLLQWIFYLLSIHPQVKETLFKELDEAFGTSTDPEDVIEQLLERGETATKQLEYTSAIIKETLRLYPPAGSARIVEKEDAFTVTDPRTGEQVPMYGIVYLCHFIIQRDEATYGPTAKQWIPERWLGQTNTSMDEYATEKPANGAGKDTIPVSAWRPFERGPRNCVGQELANIEARVIIACAARKYAFEKIGVGAKVLDEKGSGILDERGRFKVQSEMYSKHRVTSKPVDNMLVKVSFAE